MTDEEFLQALGGNIRRLRKAQGRTMLDIGSKVNLEESAIQRIEKGRANSTIKTIRKVAEALEVDFQDLFDFTHFENPNA